MAETAQQKRKRLALGADKAKQAEAGAKSFGDTQGMLRSFLAVYGIDKKKKAQ